MASVLTIIPARSASSFKIWATLFSNSAITSLLVERKSSVNQASAALALTTSPAPSIPTLMFEGGSVGTSSS